MSFSKMIVRLLPILFLLGTVPSFACSDVTSPTGGCCKVCHDGKACGDTCIAKGDTCTKGTGCACNG